MMNNEKSKTVELIDTLPVVGAIATMPSRIHTFAKMLPKVLAQVDVLYIYLDGYKKIPEALIAHPKCRPFLLTAENNLHTSSRYLAPKHFINDAIIVLFDDDILYPSNYVKVIKAALIKYGHQSVVGFHASTFCPPHTSYANDRINYHFAKSLSKDTIVHILGSGTAAFLSRIFCPNPNTWRHSNMSDLYLTAEALKLNLSLISLKRMDDWLIPLEQNQKDSIWRSVKNDDSIQSSFMRDILSQYANTQWRSWWAASSETSQDSLTDETIKSNNEIELNTTEQIICIKKTFKFCIQDPATSLNNSQQFIPFAVGDRKRYATCSGVAWITDDMFATVNLYGQNLQVYQTSKNQINNSVSLIYEVKEGIQFPESISISPNKMMMAISHTMSSTKGLSIHNIDCTGGFNIKQSKDIRKGTYHSLCFTPDSRFLAATEIGNVGFVEIIDTSTFKTTFVQRSRLSPLRPKSVSISPDGEFIIVISGSVVKPTNEELNTVSVISLHKFNQNTGDFDDHTLAELEFSDGKFVSIEDSCIILSMNNKNIFNLVCVDQANDKLQNFTIDTKTYEIQYQGCISNEVSFPHGIDISPSRTSLAVANYGDNSIRILSL